MINVLMLFVVIVLGCFVAMILALGVTLVVTTDRRVVMWQARRARQNSKQVMDIMFADDEYDSDEETESN